jgi:hypothetical protein
MNRLLQHREAFFDFCFFLFAMGLKSQPFHFIDAAILERLELSPSLMRAVMVYYAKQFVDIMSSTAIGDV